VHPKYVKKVTFHENHKNVGRVLAEFCFGTETLPKQNSARILPMAEYLQNFIWTLAEFWQNFVLVLKRNYK